MMAAANPFAEDAHDSPLLREVFCVLLEVRAHAEAHGAQLDRMGAQTGSTRASTVND